MLELREVSVVRGSTTVLDRISCVLGQGRCTALTGPSGAGKSTMLRLLNRLIEPTSGTVLLQDRELPSYDVRALRRRVGLVQQTPVLLGSSVLDDLRVGAPELSVEQASSLLVRAGLEGMAVDRTTSGLSGGEAQRLCLARALAVEPEVLLLDEPTSALDAAAAHLVEHVVLALVADGLTVVLVSHDAAQTARLADDVIALRAGRVLA
ncbi:MAG: transporter [Frankiales bacterium]|nr:transporter [Frankiales bacterium]